MRQRFVVSHEFDSISQYSDFSEGLIGLRIKTRKVDPKVRLYQRLINLHPLHGKEFYEARLTLSSPTPETFEKAKEEFGNFLKKYNIELPEPD